MDLHKTLKFAENLALRVGQFIQQSQPKVSIIVYKDRQDIVTNIDLEAERIIIQAIKKNFPHHSIYSEEAGHEDKKSIYKWYIDPIDGTKEYLRGLPQFNTCFVLEKNRQPIIAVLNRYVSNEFYSAAKGIGAFLNQKSIQISPQKNLKDSFVFTYLPPYKIPTKISQKAWHQLYLLSRQAYRVRGIAEESAAMCWVAAGKIEATMNLGPQAKWHDIIPGMFIAQMAGAKITNIKGLPLKTHDLSHGFIVSNHKIHSQILSAIND